MDTTIITTDFTTLLILIGILVVMTNIIVEVLKKMTWDKIPTNILAIIVALALTIVIFFAYASYIGMTVLWYHIAAAVILAFMVAYAAMFGFDKLKEALAKINDLKT